MQISELVVCFGGVTDLNDLDVVLSGRMVRDCSNVVVERVVCEMRIRENSKRVLESVVHSVVDERPVLPDLPNFDLVRVDLPINDVIVNVAVMAISVGKVDRKPNSKQVRVAQAVDSGVVQPLGDVAKVVLW